MSQYPLSIYHSKAPFDFLLAGQLPELFLRYECYGELSPAKDNVILINHSLSTDSHVQSHEHDPSPGWWEGMVGPGKALDTSRFFVICVSNLGACGGSSGPTTLKPNSSQAYRADFPQTTFQDIVQSQKCLLEHLGISQLHAIVAYSMGAMISLMWAYQEPAWVRRAVFASSCYKAYPTNLANRAIQRDMITLDPCWQHGHYQQNSFPGFNLARRLAMLSYRTPTELNDRFPDPSGPNSLASYLTYNAEKFTQRFDANCYLNLLAAMDHFNLCSPQELIPDLSPIQADTLVISVDSDELYPPNQQADLYHALKLSGNQTSYIEHSSAFGHDAFVLDKAAFSGYLKPFLEQ